MTLEYICVQVCMYLQIAAEGGGHGGFVFILATDHYRVLQIATSTNQQNLFSMLNTYMYGFETEIVINVET